MAKKKKSKSAHPTESFQDLVSKKNVEALIPIVDKRVNELGQQLARNQMGLAADLGVRLAVIEDLAMKRWKLSRTQMEKRLLDKEDEGLGLSQSKKPATEGDFVRTTVSVKNAGEKEFGSERRINLNNLVTQPTLLLDVEKEVLGMKSGEEKIVKVDVSDRRSAEDRLKKGEDVKQFVDFKLKVDRISFRKEESSAESKDAR